MTYRYDQDWFIVWLFPLSRHPAVTTANSVIVAPRHEARRQPVKRRRAAFSTSRSIVIVDAWVNLHLSRQASLLRSKLSFKDSIESDEFGRLETWSKTSWDVRLIDANYFR